MPANLQRRRLLGSGLGVCAGLGLSPPLWAQGAGTRVALVIGNAAYAGAPLPNAANDAAAMARVLRGLGFTVVELRNGTKAQMDAATAQACELLKGRDGTGLLYYAGHGMQLDWRNFLLPVDAKPNSAADVPRQALDTQSTLDAFREAGTRMNIVVLDACRDNPFSASSSGKGLAPLDAPPGSYLAFSTAPGNVAEDGNDADGNGLYTRFLVQELQSANARIEDVFKRVRLQVRRASQGRQVPWDMSSLEEDFVFATGRPAPEPSRRERDAQLLAQRSEWVGIKDSVRAEDFVTYLLRFPSGALAELAQFKLDQLQSATVQATPPRDQPSALPSGQDRYTTGDVMVVDRIDGYTGLATRLTRRVTAADRRRVEINGGEVVHDQMGSLLLADGLRKDPPMLEFPAELQLGKRWQTTYRNLDAQGRVVSSFEHTFRVVAFEDVQVPAGRFKAFKVERTGQGGGAGWTGFNREWARYWIDPITMRPLRFELQRRDNFKMLDFYSEVLVSQTRGPGHTGR